MNCPEPYLLQPDHLTPAVDPDAEDVSNFRGVILKYLKLSAKVKIRDPLRLLTRKQLETFIPSR